MASEALGNARQQFVLLLEQAKEIHGAGKTGEGPNKLIARKMRISPARVGDFLNESFSLLKNGKHREVEEVQFRKIVNGFATSVERSINWLISEGIANKGTAPGTPSIVEGYWPQGFHFEFSEPLAQQAIREGMINARREARKKESIEVKLWIARWGVADRPGPEELEDTFFARFGTAVFRGVQPERTKIGVVSKTLAEVLTDLPLRSARGDWAVSVGTYDLLDRRFEGLDFVTFPALRFPISALLFSREKFPPTVQVGETTISTGEIAFSLKGSAPNCSILSANFPLRRLVASADASTCSALYSMFASQESANDHLEKLPEGVRALVGPRLIEKADKYKAPMVFIGDGQLVFEVSFVLIHAGFSVRVLPQDVDRPEFSFLSGIMFRDEAHKFQEHLAEAQRQIFRAPQRVVEFLQHFLKGVEVWLKVYGTPEVSKIWRDSRAPVYAYPVNQMASYLTSAYGHSPSIPDLSAPRAREARASLDAIDIYAQLREYCRSLEHADLLEVLFQQTGE